MKPKPPVSIDILNHLHHNTADFDHDATTPIFDVQEE